MYPSMIIYCIYRYIFQWWCWENDGELVTLILVVGRRVVSRLMEAAHHGEWTIKVNYEEDDLIDATIRRVFLLNIPYWIQGSWGSLVIIALLLW